MKKIHMIILGILILSILGILVAANFATSVNISETLSPSQKKFQNLNNTANEIILEGQNWKIQERNTIQMEQLNISDQFQGNLRTSTWFKPIVPNGCQNTALFPIPHIIDIKPSSFSITVPSKTATENNVILNRDAPIEFTFENDFESCQLKEGQQITATFQLNHSQNQSTEITAGKGFPYIYVKTLQNSLKLNTDNVQKVSENLYKAQIGESIYGLRFTSAVDFSIENAQFNSQDAIGEFIIFYHPKTAQFNSLADLYKVKKPQVEVEFGSDSNNSYQVLNFFENTPYLLLPHHTSAVQDDEIILGEYGISSLRGNLTLVYTDKLSLKYPNIEAEIFPNINLSNEQKDELKQLLRADTQRILNSDNSNAGIYWKGKELAKIANLLYVADQVQAEKEYNQLLELLKTEIEDLAQPSDKENDMHFTYDPQIKSIFSSRPEFGHERLNDHHFHYAYYIYTFAVLNKLEPEYMQQYKTFVDQLIRSVASLDLNDPAFPYLRHYDLYENHSWASGLDYFGDGNNQESSSEEMNFWYSVYMWKSLNNDAASATLYKALYNITANSINSYYFNTYSRNDIFPKEYKHPIASILWEGKYDFATWFSADPNAIHGIQIIPLTLGSGYLKHEDFAEQNLSSQKNLNEGDWTTWKDMTAGYAMINGIENSDLSFDQIDETDSGNTKTWFKFLEIYFNK